MELAQDYGRVLHTGVLFKDPSPGPTFEQAVQQRQAALVRMRTLTQKIEKARSQTRLMLMLLFAAIGDRLSSEYLVSYRSMATAGERPSIESTSGFSMRSRNWRA